MKIGIITMPLCANYGGTLQNWALQQTLIRMGHEPITLRFPVSYQGMSSVHFWVKVFPRQFASYIAHLFIGKRLEKPQTIRMWKKSISGMERFVQERINVTDYLPNLSMEDARRYGVEALIVGSDQIWRPVMYDAVKYYFLGFAKDFDILRIAYAPSVALSEWPFKEETTLKLKELIKKFSAISVREDSSVKLIKDNLGVDAQWVLDPTMLLQRRDYLAVCKDVPEDTESFVFAYILDMNDEKKKLAEIVAEACGCRVKYLTADKVKEDDTIEKWRANFRDANFVVTDSYHGTVFSLIFQKQFYSFYNNYRGNARMDSLKKISGLNKRFVEKDFDDIRVQEEIDYAEVERKINLNRDKSISFLRESLAKS